MSPPHPQNIFFPPEVGDKSIRRSTEEILVWNAEQCSVYQLGFLNFVC